MLLIFICQLYRPVQEITRRISGVTYSRLRDKNGQMEGKTQKKGFSCYINL